MDTDVDYLRKLVNEYQVLIAPVNEELTYYKRDNELLKKDLFSLEQENKLLSLKLEETLRTLTSSTVISHRFSEQDLIDNLKCQLEFSIKEKESITEMWKTSVKRIDHLESELKLYTAGSQSNSRTEVNKVKKAYDKRIKQLQSELGSSQVKLEEAIKASQESLECKKLELNKILEKQNETVETVKKLEAEINLLQEKQTQVQTSKSKLEKSLEDKNDTIMKLKAEAHDAKLKVAEACHVAEAAMIEKDVALNREKEAQEEIYQLMKTLSEIVNETEEKVISEINAVKQQYNGKLHNFRLELRKSHDELELKNLDLEKRENLCKQLETEIERVRQSNSDFVNMSASEKNILTKKIEEIYQQLLCAERKNIQLAGENEAIRESMDQLLKTKEVSCSSRDAEKKVLESRIKSQQNELELSNLKLVEVATEVEELNDKIRTMNSQYYEQSKLKSAQSDKKLKERITEIKSINQRINSELKSQLQAQITLNHKWKNEVRQVTDKLETRIQELRSEVTELKIRKKDLEVRLREMECKCAEYKTHLIGLCTEFNNMASAFVS